MKVHNNLKELLEDFISESRQIHPKPYWLKSTGDRFVKKYLSSNSLALGKPEPLAKNKQTENNLKNKNNKCDYPLCSCNTWCKRQRLT